MTVVRWFEVRLLPDGDLNFLERTSEFSSLPAARDFARSVDRGVAGVLHPESLHLAE